MLCRELDLFSQAIVAIDGSKFKPLKPGDGAKWPSAWRGNTLSFSHLPARTAFQNALSSMPRAHTDKPARFIRWTTETFA
jgi:hypothetical protein